MRTVAISLMLSQAAVFRPGSCRQFDRPDLPIPGQPLGQFVNSVIFDVGEPIGELDLRVDIIELGGPGRLAAGTRRLRITTLMAVCHLRHMCK